MRARITAAAAIAAAVAASIVVTAWPSEAATLPATGANYYLAVTKSGMCIDVPSASTANGALLQQWGCTDGAKWQQWTLKAVGSYYQLANVNSGRCIDVPSSSTTSGVQLQQWGCGDSTKTNQLWKLTASGTNTGRWRHHSGDLHRQQQQAVGVQHGGRRQRKRTDLFQHGGRFRAGNHRRRRRHRRHGHDL